MSSLSTPCQTSHKQVDQTTEFGQIDVTRKKERKSGALYSSDGLNNRQIEFLSAAFENEDFKSSASLHQSLSRSDNQITYIHHLLYPLSNKEQTLPPPLRQVPDLHLKDPFTTWHMSQWTSFQAKKPNALLRMHSWRPIRRLCPWSSPDFVPSIAALWYTTA